MENNSKQCHCGFGNFLNNVRLNFVNPYKFDIEIFCAIQNPSVETEGQVYELKFMYTVTQYLCNEIVDLILVLQARSIWIRLNIFIATISNSNHVYSTQLVYTTRDKN